MNEFIIETDQLSKSFKSQPALCGLDLRVPVGSIFGFLGRNGAGKTTTIKTLMGLLRAELDFTPVERILAGGLHEYLDSLQEKMNTVDSCILNDFATPLTQSQVAGAHAD